MSEQFSTVEAAVEAIARGEIIIVVDAEDRENEGDFVCSAERASPAAINFMITHGRGQVCIPILPDVCERLKLPMMVETNTAPLGTAFTVPIDHRTNKTGITAQERAATVQAVIDPESKPTDFVRPGHMFPLRAREGGVLRRAGHTEAAIDLARLAGVLPGRRALRDSRRPRQSGRSRAPVQPGSRTQAANHHDRATDSLSPASARSSSIGRPRPLLPTNYGDGRIIAYGVKYETQEPLAVRDRRPDEDAAPLVRMHSSCFTGDLLDSLRCDCGDQLHMALKMISDAGAGVLVYLPQEGRGIGLVDKIKAYALQDEGSTRSKPTSCSATRSTAREYGVGIQILKDLGLRKIRLLTNNPKKIDAFLAGGFDLEVVDQIPIIPPIHEHNAKYLATKRDKMGHTLPDAVAFRMADTN